MPGGDKNIRPSDNPKPFKKGNKAAEKWTEKRALDLGKELIEWLNEVDEYGDDKGNILFNEFLIIKKGLYHDVITYLRDKYTTFSKLYKQAKKIQETKIVKYGLADRLNPSMSKFILSAKHGYAEKSKKDVKVTNTQPLKIEVSKEAKDAIDDLLNEDD